MTPSFKCSNCGYVCTEAGMTADYQADEDGELWCNHICPKCDRWGAWPNANAIGECGEDGLWLPLIAIAKMGGDTA